MRTWHWTPKRSHAEPSDDHPQPTANSPTCRTQRADTVSRRESRAPRPGRAASPGRRCTAPASAARQSSAPCAATGSASSSTSAVGTCSSRCCRRRRSLYVWCWAVRRAYGNFFNCTLNSRRSRITTIKPELSYNITDVRRQPNYKNRVQEYIANKWIDVDSLSVATELTTIEAECRTAEQHKKNDMPPRVTARFMCGCITINTVLLSTHAWVSLIKASFMAGCVC